MVKIKRSINKYFLIITSCVMATFFVCSYFLTIYFNFNVEYLIYIFGLISLCFNFSLILTKNKVGILSYFLTLLGFCLAFSFIVVAFGKFSLTNIYNIRVNIFSTIILIISFVTDLIFILRD